MICVCVSLGAVRITCVDGVKIKMSSLSYRLSDDLFFVLRKGKLVASHVALYPQYELEPTYFKRFWDGSADEIDNFSDIDMALCACLHWLAAGVYLNNSERVLYDKVCLM